MGSKIEEELWIGMKEELWIGMKEEQQIQLVKDRAYTPVIQTSGKQKRLFSFTHT